MAIQLRPYQQDCVDAFYRYYAEGNDGHGLIVVPTAGGKSLIIGSLATEICQRWPGQRIIILSHVRELIQQNHSKVLACWSGADAGVYSAALRKRQAHCDIVTATVQSVYQKAAVIGHRDLCFIDEAHLLQPSGLGMYGRLLADLLRINPAMKICGFTATDYRIDFGRLTEGDGALFNDVLIEITIQQLLDEGYLTPPISKASLVQADLEGVRHTAGEFNTKDMAERFDQREFINAALDSDMPYMADRRSIALFCATLDNAGHVADGMLARGIDCEVIDGEMSGEDREDKLERFRSGELRALASVGVITTGTDIVNMDCVSLFRATESPGLYQQIVGRGFRVMYAPGMPIDTAEQRWEAIRAGQKPNFLTLDHGGNIERHGPITAVEKPQRREKGERVAPRRAKIRICEICRSGWPLDVRVCATCGHEMVVERDPTAALDIDASSADILGSAFLRGEVAQWFDVEDVRYSEHKRQDNGKLSIKITYHCGIMQFNEWKSLFQVAALWLGDPMEQADSFSDVVKKCQNHLRKPCRIQVHKKNKFYEVLRYDFQTQMMRETSHAEIHAGG